MALLFQEDTEAAVDKSKTAGGFIPEHNAREFWEAVKDQLDEHWVKDNVLVMEQVAAQVTEEQSPENITAEDVSELDPNLCSDACEHTGKCGKGATEQENTLSIIHGTFENTNLTACAGNAPPLVKIW